MMTSVRDEQWGSIGADPTARRPQATPEGASVLSDRCAQRKRWIRCPHRVSNGH